jgi:hypothetical protein
MNWKEQVDLNIRLAHAPVHEMRLNDSRDYIRKLFFVLISRFGIGTKRDQLGFSWALINSIEFILFLLYLTEF